jgi:predicted CoA-binding protein
MPSNRVDVFYGSRSFAVIGVSKSRQNFARAVYDSLQLSGKSVYAIGSEIGEFRGIKIYDAIRSLPAKPEAIIVCTKPNTTSTILKEIADSGAGFVWFQQGSFNKATLNEAAIQGIDPIKGCVMMYMPGGSWMHGFHRTINEWLGRGYR